MTDQRETLEVDVLFVGAGPASLAGALHLQNLVNAHNERVKSTGEGSELEPMVVIIEKGQEVGAHSFSGAVLDPIALKELIPDYLEQGAPIEKTVDTEDVYFLTKKNAFRFPVVPPQLRNHGNHTISLSKLTRWMGGLCEAAGVNIFPGFAGTEILHDGDRVSGVRTGDKGIDKDGERKSNFEPGIDLVAKVTAFGDGARGYLSKQLIARHNLDNDRAPQIFETGVKEIIEMPAGSVEGGRVVHTMGYPFRSDNVGGTWIYHLGDNLLSVGLVTPLDYKDPLIHPFEQLQQFKAQPKIASMLKGGKSIAYGAKVISAGGWQSMPKLTVDGAILMGESAGMVDLSRLKGIHLAMKSGMLAAEQIFSGLVKDDFSDDHLAGYETAVKESYIGKQLYKARNFHGAMAKGLPRAFFHLGIQTVTGGHDLQFGAHKHVDRESYTTVAQYYGIDRDIPEPPPTDGSLHLDKLANVYNSGTMHNEDQPCHLKIADFDTCYNTCTGKYKYPCNRFCPANVYEMVTNEETGGLKLQVNFANCVHCQTCDINCPEDNIRWTPPEGGDGPNYQLL